MVGGADQTSLRKGVAFLKSHGFNAVRIPLAVDALLGQVSDYSLLTTHYSLFTTHYSDTTRYANALLGQVSVKLTRCWGRLM